MSLEEPGVITPRRARILAYLLGGGVGPNGMAVDEQGNLYVAYFDAGEVVVFTGKGKRIGAIKLLAGADTFAMNVTLGGRTAGPSILSRLIRTSSTKWR